MVILAGEVIFQFSFLPPFSIGSILNEKSLLLQKFISVRVEPFKKGYVVQGNGN